MPPYTERQTREPPKQPPPPIPPPTQKTTQEGENTPGRHPQGNPTRTLKEPRTGQNTIKNTRPQGKPRIDPLNKEHHTKHTSSGKLNRKQPYRAPVRGIPPPHLRSRPSPQSIPPPRFPRMGPCIRATSTRLHPLRVSPPRGNPAKGRPVRDALPVSLKRCACVGVVRTGGPCVGYAWQGYTLAQWLCPYLMA